MATGLEGVNERDEKDAKEIEEIKRLREAIRAGIDPKTGRRLTPKGRNRIQRRLGRLERLHHRPKIEISLPTVVRISLDDSWGYDAARPSCDPPSEPDAGGMVQRGLITFPRGIPQGGSGKILLRVDCQAFDLFAPFDVIHLTAKWAGLDVTVGATGPGVVPPGVFGKDFGKSVNTFQDKALGSGIFFFRDGNPASGIFVLLVDAIPTATASQNLTITATDSGGSDSQSITINQ